MQGNRRGTSIRQAKRLQEWIQRLVEAHISGKFCRLIIHSLVRCSTSLLRFDKRHGEVYHILYFHPISRCTKTWAYGVWVSHYTIYRRRGCLSDYKICVHHGKICAVFLRRVFLSVLFYRISYASCLSSFQGQTFWFAWNSSYCIIEVLFRLGGRFTFEIKCWRSSYLLIAIICWLYCITVMSFANVISFAARCEILRNNTTRCVSHHP